MCTFLLVLHGSNLSSQVFYQEGLCLPSTMLSRSSTVVIMDPSNTKSSSCVGSVVRPGNDDQSAARSLVHPHVFCTNSVYYSKSSCTPPGTRIPLFSAVATLEVDDVANSGLRILPDDGT